MLFRNSVKSLANLWINTGRTIIGDHSNIIIKMIGHRLDIQAIIADTVRNLQTSLIYQKGFRRIPGGQWTHQYSVLIDKSR